MADRTLALRVAALERQTEGKTLQQHFREQAELIDQLFVYRFEEFEKQQDAKWDAKLDTKLAALEERTGLRSGIPSLPRSKNGRM